MLGSKKTGFGGGGTTLVSRETVIIGDIRFSGTLEVEGLVQGNILAEDGKDALVRIVDKGRVEGEIRVPSAMINGTVQGDVYSTHHLELAPKGRVQGNVYYATLEMAAGSEVNGSLKHQEEGASAGESAPDPAVEVTEAGPGTETQAAAVASVKVD